MHNFNDVQNILASTQNDVLSMHFMHIILLILESITSYSRSIIIYIQVRCIFFV